MSVTSSVQKLAILLLAITNLAIANELIISDKAPDGLKALATKIEVQGDTPLNTGPHGLEEYCYKTNVYVVYSTNLLGYGYQLSEDSPQHLECSEPKTQILSKNNLGMYIGMPKKEVEAILGQTDLEDKQTIIWQKEVHSAGQRYDLQTYTELLFKQGRLVWLSVFTTETT